MIKIIAGRQGSGKTKTIIKLANEAVKVEKGNVVFIERKSQLIYDLDRDIRLVSAQEYNVRSYDRFFGFISGLTAGNYDITHIFIDNTLRIVKNEDVGRFEEFVGELCALAKQANTKFTISVSFDEEQMSENMRQYL